MNPDQSQGDPVAEAIARRQGGQQSQQAPQISSPQPPQAPPMPPMGAPAPQGDKFVPRDSHEMLVSTLAESLKNEHQLEMEKLKLGQQAPMMTA